MNQLSDRNSHEIKLLARFVRGDAEEIQEAVKAGLNGKHFSDPARGAFFDNLVEAFEKQPDLPIEFFKNGIRAETLKAFDEDERKARNRVMYFISGLLDPDIDVNFSPLTYAKALIGSVSSNGAASKKKKKDKLLF